MVIIMDATDSKEYQTNPDSGGYPAYLFHQGTNFFSYDYMGAHPSEDKKHIIFRVWAPNASEVFLCGDFNGWNRESHKMTRITDGGVWEISVESGLFGANSKYKYRIIGGGYDRLKADPYAFFSETREKTASVYFDISGFEWSDREWMENRLMKSEGMRSRHYPEPLNIYELHLGSWKTRDGKPSGDGQSYLSYSEIAYELIPYVKQMGYTHVELLPVMEHPFDGSWGYQITGYYAPTSRFGNPFDFMGFVNALHMSGIGVILDWVPAHFPKDEHGLYEFDGSPLYEYQGSDRMEHKSWGTRCFDVGRNEVQSFLISNAMFWFRMYHIDGLRTDAVASMLYLDYDRAPGEWTKNSLGTNESLEAVAFFKKLNSAAESEFPDVMMIAEESTAWPKVSHPVPDGGLGFNFKWNMGFANDMFAYISTDPYFRHFEHGKLTFPLVYAFSENFILPVSHDEVVYGKKSLFNKIFGDDSRCSGGKKFSGFKAFMCHIMAHPGKKLIFMGSEFGQFNEWNYQNQLDWHLLQNDENRRLRLFSAELNHFYLSHPEFWEIDYSWDGFHWLIPDDSEHNVIEYIRRDKKGSSIIAAINFSDSLLENYRLRTEKDGEYEILFSSDDKKFGGSGALETGMTKASENNTMCLTLPPLTGIYFKYSRAAELNADDIQTVIDLTHESDLRYQPDK